MEKVKTWEEYTKEEQTALLNHWFYYYGGMLLTLEDFDNFAKIVSTRQDDIFNQICTEYIVYRTIQTNMLVQSMRQGITDELFTHSIVITPDKTDIYPEYLKVRNTIVSEIAHTKEHPEPPVPMDIAIVVEEGPTK